MSVLSQKLLSELDRDGFCHDALKRVQFACRDALAQSPVVMDPCDHVMLYVLEDVCLRVSEWMDNALGVGAGADPTAHDAVEAKFVRPFREAVEKLGEPVSCAVKMVALSGLLDASRGVRFSVVPRRDF